MGKSKNGSMLYMIVFALGFLGIGCYNSAPSDAIDLTREDVVSVHDIFSEIRIVMPETHPDYLISTITSIEHHKGNYYIFDIKSQQVFCVDEEGRFQFKISAQGHGPGEYVYLGHMSLDRFNDQILLLEPSMQRLQVFDLEGQHVQTFSIAAEVIMAYNYAFALNADTLLLISITGDQLIFFCRDKAEIIGAELPMALAEGVYPFTSTFMSFYHFNNRAYFLPALSQQIVDITHLQPEPYYTWDFGPNNNGEKQYNRLIAEIKERGFQDRFLYPHHAVGQGKILHHDILKIAETERFKISIVEFNTDWRNVIIDKKENTYYVFRAFKEGVSLTYLNISEDMALGSAGEFGYVATEYRNRVLSRFHPSVLSHDDNLKLKDWDEMKDNMFFVVYTFKD